ncbi:MAG: PrpF family protein [Chromatiales bacterium]|nr:PrpF family protein [Chromatiales bacterium]
MQTRIPAVFMRGGTSKGVFFHRRDVPADQAALDAMLLKVLGSPDPNGRQLNGMGGGISSLSKAVVIGPPSRPDADVDYTFAQVAVDRPLVDYSSNCGNLSSAVGPFAVDEGLLKVSGSETLVRIHNTNTQRVVHARFPLNNGVAEIDGDFELPGVAGTGARIDLEFLSPGGATTGELLPGDGTTDTIRDPGDGAEYHVSLVDASNGTVFVSAQALGLIGTEAPDIIEQDVQLMAKLDRLRRAGGVKMGVADTPDGVPLANPKIAMVAKPATYTTLEGATIEAAAYDIAVRILSMERAHRATPLTSGMCVAAASLIPGTLAHDCAVDSLLNDTQVRVGHPSGMLVVGAEVIVGNRPSVAKTMVYRTARRLMEGSVLVPK